MSRGRRALLVMGLLLACAGVLAGADVDALPDWPEGLGRLESGRVESARASLEQAGRSAQARYLAALLLLGPAPEGDAEAAREELEAIAKGPGDSQWKRRARYALAWQHEQWGRADAAEDVYTRLVVDEPETEEGSRSRVGLARLLLRRGLVGRAARMLEEASEAGVAAETHVGELKELVARVAGFGPPAGAATASPVRRPTGLRAVDGFAPRAGGVLVGSRREGGVFQLDASGERVAHWNLEDLLALAVNRIGRAYAATPEGVWRLDPGGTSTRVADTGEFSPPAAMAADDAGGLWLLDRRRERIGRIEPGRDQVDTYWEDPEARVTDLAWDGRRLVAIDGRRSRVFAIDRDGTEDVLLDRGLDRPVALAADLAGRIAVLDAPGARVWLLAPDGKVETHACAGERPRPTAVGIGGDGAIQWFDEGDGAWVRLP